ncbi:tyrosine-type recombinase/integrase [Clostridium butyricum]|uniref:Site-specific recombinase, phage integrase family n=1 Tax=Clostridium butyricum E4 str. BoNT E BL5262 TaxID=632245 RepID=C4II40_CLOBU|nr:tyrosine-type recombinase/integrase [Clostridium butyricum]EDT75822.1 site-specific recombinase [Clostridium butyricum 5521]EEP54115.1 site-specific recombinase, phage integrase family [Clostridium butyricum E4 str. BoNT E BL5262]NFL33210.1 recombinase [Clostridium butyricum]NFS20428.1 recombinase [Clostridium butyricum]
METEFKEKLIEYASDKKTRNKIYKILEQTEDSDYIDDEDFDLKDFSALTIKNPLDLKRIQNYLKEHNDKLYILWMIGQNTGLRGSDIVKLTIYDLRQAIKNKKMIVVEQKIESIMSEKIKNNRPIRKTTRREIKRTVFINNYLINLLKEFVYGKSLSEFVYPTNSKEGHIRRDSLGKAYKRTLVKLKIAKADDSVGTHTPRKTYGYIQYKENGGDINKVQELFGHSSPRITRVYIGLDDEEKEQSARTMDKYTFN